MLPAFDRATNHRSADSYLSGYLGEKTFEIKVMSTVTFDTRSSKARMNTISDLMKFALNFWRAFEHIETYCPGETLSTEERFSGGAP